MILKLCLPCLIDFLYVNRYEARVEALPLYGRMMGTEGTQREIEALILPIGTCRVLITNFIWLKYRLNKWVSIFLI